MLVFLLDGKAARDDMVLDIGAGKGAITNPLSRKCRQIIAIEWDMALARVLDRWFPSMRGEEVLCLPDKCHYSTFCEIAGR
jgi:16S rRNA A1518/A1519 N6-dimethyltransferase RsmA/KsgA/DIM1 with predicted DNA glycosylase/AP lyase activity